MFLLIQNMLKSLVYLLPFLEKPSSLSRKEYAKKIIKKIWISLPQKMLKLTKTYMKMVRNFDTLLFILGIFPTKTTRFIQKLCKIAKCFVVELQKVVQKSIKLAKKFFVRIFGFFGHFQKSKPSNFLSKSKLSM